MKQVLLLSVMLLQGIYFTYAQDIIVKKTGDELRVKIEEINRSEIIFRYFDSLDSRLFFITKAEVFMIKYADGRKEVIYSPQEKANVVNNGALEMRGSRYYINGGLIREASVYDLIRESKNESAINEMEQAKSAKSGGKVLLFTGIGLGSIGLPIFTIGIEELSSGRAINSIMATGIGGIAIGATCIIVGVNIMYEHKQHMQKAIQLYNAETK